LTSFERSMCDRENLVFDSLIYLESVERFLNRIGVMLRIEAQNRRRIVEELHKEVEFSILT